MIGPPGGVRVYLACGVTDMRKGMIGLAMLVQQGLSDDPFSGALFAFRGRKCRADQGALARRPGHVPVRQAPGARPLRVATHRRRGGDDHSSAARLSAGGHRLAAAATDHPATGGGLMRHGDSESG